MKLLVAIANYGTNNDQYLHRLLAEYRSMSFRTDIVVLSNIPKDLGPDVEVRVGLPTKDPWSLPFGHKQLFADRLNGYDLFIYSEDDTLITERNIRAFLKVDAILPQDEIPGFLRFEIGPSGERNYCDVHRTYHWDPLSVRSRDQYTLAFFTNEHAACYILTRPQLEQAIRSGGFLVRPHRGEYDLACTAATDPYTQCGFRKLICISHIEDFLLHHLPNKYVGDLGVDGLEFRRQMETLLNMARNGAARAPLFRTQTLLKDKRYTKDYYEPVRQEVVSRIPDRVRSVLSIGCGWGATEAWLASKGLRVVAAPIDSVISASAEARGIALVQGDLRAIRGKLVGEVFDCLLLSNVLHLVEDPVEWLSSFRHVLSNESKVIAVVPNLSRLPVIWRRIRSDERFKNLRSYEESGVQITSHRIVKAWFKQAGLRVEQITDVLSSPTVRKASRFTLGLADPILSSELIVVAKRF